MSTPIDVQRARRETPGCEHVLHLNNAGAALMPHLVLAAMTQHLQLEANIGGYEAARQEEARIERFYTATAALLNCLPEEVAFVENATRAWDQAFYSIPFQPGDRILTAQAEYASNFIAFLQVAKRTGAKVEVIPSDEWGQVSVAALEEMLDERVKLIAITHVPTNGGLVNPAAMVGALARARGILYLLDACQSVGQMPIDVQQIGCDFLSATGRKFLRGPRGTGLLYVRREICQQLEPPLLDLHAATWTSPTSYVVRPDARRFENWEMNYAGKLGLTAAIDYALSWDPGEIERRNRQLATLLREGLRAIKGCRVLDLGQQPCAIVSFVMGNIPPCEIQHRLHSLQINVSVSPREYTLLDMDQRELASVVRASVHYYNTEAEIERALAALHELCE
ncbi:putative cysteine desulfurase [Anatilimnocola aggregata]|uniref:Putative cysteine desulfurase n=1 Tax=Anatilimnocola aggregata TaxID=2528021 RepID=A0A517YJL2_9BACT|nr:aminotransferase class V-fold PLP-dependent enzyme [Anatilimnocola aggregata]QDU30402.1 putative cysteine desulfurase [Anatilimnocola aggregata]